MKLFFKYPITVLLIWGLVLRMVVWFFYGHITIFPDSEGYESLAKLISSGSLSGYDGTRSPGYPVLLALLGNQNILLVALQMSLGIYGTVLLFKNLKLLQFSSATSLVLSLLLGSLLHVIFYETAILTESVTFFVFLLLFNILFNRYFEKKSFLLDILLGFLLVYLILVKPFYIFIPFIIYGFYILKQWHWKAFMRSKIIIVILPMMAFLSWSYVNKLNTGYFVPTTFFGYNIAQNCVHFAEKSSPKYAEIAEIYVRHREKSILEDKDVAMSIWSANSELQAKTNLSLPDLSALLSEFSKETIDRNPIDYLKQVSVSWSDFWRTSMYWNVDNFRIKAATPTFIFIWDIQHYFLKFFKIAFLLNVPLLLYEFLKNRRFSDEIMITTIIIAASVLQAFSTYGTNSRFSYPFEFFMVVVVLLQVKRHYYRYQKTN